MDKVIDASINITNVDAVLSVIKIINKELTADFNHDVYSISDQFMKVIPLEITAILIVSCNKKLLKYSAKSFSHVNNMERLCEYIKTESEERNAFLNRILSTGNPVVVDCEWMNRMKFATVGKHSKTSFSKVVAFPHYKGGNRSEYVLFFANLIFVKSVEKLTLENKLLSFINEMLHIYSDSIYQVYTNNLNVDDVLTKRESEIISYAIKGKTSNEIGIILSISERTVRFHFTNIYIKLDVVNRPQAIGKILNEGISLGGNV